MLTYIASLLLVATNPADASEKSKDCSISQEVLSEEESQATSEIVFEDLLSDETDQEMEEE